MEQRHRSEEWYTIPSAGRDIRLLVMRPVASARPPEQTPGILWIHGGRLKKRTRERDPRSHRVLAAEAVC